MSHARGCNEVHAMHSGHQRCSVACRKLLDDLELVKNNGRATVMQFLTVKVGQAAFEQVVIHSGLDPQLLLDVMLMYKLL